MSSSIERLERYADTHPKEFPKLRGALRAFRSFVGNKEVKNSVAKLIMYYLSYARVDKTRRRSTRKRKPRHEEPPVRRTRRRSDSVDSEVTEEQAGAALMAAFLQAVAENGDSSDEEWIDESEESSTRPEWMVGNLMHCMIVGDPGTGKTTFAQLLVNLWDAIGLISASRYTKTTRSDWIGKYQGHSTQRAVKLITNNDVIFIDEAYSLINGRSGDDMYGQEVLTEIVAAMSDPEKHTLFVFAGYKGDIEKLYNANRGLERRFGYIFELKKPTPAELFLIFQKQLKKLKWKIVKKERNKALEWFGKNASFFTFGGGSTEQFLFHAQQNAIERTFPETGERSITLEDMETAVETLRLVGRKKETRQTVRKRALKNTPRAQERLRKRKKKSPTSPLRLARHTSATIRNMYI